MLLVVDCGRRMASKDELSHFDHALNAALLLAHVALRQGDAVGLMTMAGVDRYVRAAQVGRGGERDPEPRLRHRADCRCPITTLLREVMRRCAGARS